LIVCFYQPRLADTVGLFYQPILADAFGLFYQPRMADAVWSVLSAKIG